MNKQFQKSRLFRYGSVSVIMTVFVLTAAVLFNTAFETLAKRYSWYTPMIPSMAYDVTEEAFTTVERAFAENPNATPVEILFCSPEESVKTNSSTKQIYKTVSSFAERFGDRIRIRFTDITTNPSSVKSYLTEKNLLTGEEVSLTVGKTGVIIIGEDYHRVYAADDFYIFDSDDSSTVVAYNGEKKLAAGILHALDEGTHLACVTKNHGEAYYDTEIFTLLDDAGYSISLIDLQSDDIPENCELILCVNPNTDLVADDVSAVSEITVLENFLSQSGKSFCVLLERGTPALPHLESFLASWGVQTCSTKPNDSKVSYRYSVQDASNSLTSDDSTIYGERVKTGYSDEILSGISEYVVFKNATALEAAQGYVNQRDGSYVSGNRTLYSLYEMSDTALSWANGKVVSTDRGMMMTLTQQKTEDGKSSVGVISSVDFCTETYLKSSVYGNTEAVMRLFSAMGKNNTTGGLAAQPVRSTEISTLTTEGMLKWTLTLALVPAVAAAAVGIVVFAKRRRA